MCDAACCHRAYTFLSDWVGKYYHDNQIFEEHYEGITAIKGALLKGASMRDMRARRVPRPARHQIAASTPPDRVLPR